MAGDIAPGTLVGGRYRVEGLLGEGGMARVFAAQQIEVGTAVVLKIPGRLSTNTLARFEREVQAIARLAHPAIVRLMDSGIDRQLGVPYMVLERVYGDGLGQIVATKGPLAESEAKQLLGQIAAGLAAAHVQGILHRDLKPNNVMMDRTGRARILDFGLAKLLEDDDRAPLTAPSTTLGTPSYMSPEQVSGRPLDARCDLYALGCVAFYLLTGRPPFDAESSVDVMRAHLSAPPPPLLLPNGQRPDADLDALVRQLLMKRPGDRPANATIVAEALGTDAPNADPSQAPTTLSPALRRPLDPTDRTAILPQTLDTNESRTVREAFEPTTRNPTTRMERVGKYVVAALVLVLVIVAAIGFLGIANERRADEAARSTTKSPDEDQRPDVVVVASPDVIITSVPTGATVLVNGEEAGVTPLTLEAPSLPMNVRLQLTSYEATDVRIDRIGETRIALEKIVLPPRRSRPTRTKPSKAPPPDDFEVPVW